MEIGSGVKNSLDILPWSTFRAENICRDWSEIEAILGKEGE